MEKVMSFVKSMSVLRWVLFVIELLLLNWFIAAFPFVNMGNIFGVAACIVFMGITLRWKSFAGVVRKLCSTGSGKGIVIAVSVILAVAVVYIVILNIMMLRAVYNKPKKPNVVVVLGCQVRGERPSKMLRLRLDAAKELLDQYPDVKCIVSGGQGSDEKISEAQCMKNYLVEKGVSEDRIIMEDKSTTTSENLEFSIKKMDELGLGRDMTIVTDGYHLYRASLIAKERGAGEVTTYGADTELRMIPTYWVREWFGLTKFFVFGT